MSCFFLVDDQHMGQDSQALEGLYKPYRKLTFTKRYSSRKENARETEKYISPSRALQNGAEKNQH